MVLFYFIFETNFDEILYFMQGP